MTEPSQFNDTQRDALEKMRISRIVYPIILGVGVVLFLLWRQFDMDEFRKIEWQQAAWLWMLLAVCVMVVRHLAYSTRLYILSDREFTFKKCIELIFIWEFSSAVSPTSVGGSAVALFVLSQEKLGTARTTAIVLYTVVLDSLFFITSVPLLYFAFGPSIVRPDIESLAQPDGWGLTFILAYLFMALYGAFFFYALFIKPEHGRTILHWISEIPFMKRWQERIMALGDGFVEASRELWSHKAPFHIKAFLSTAVAWSLRFIVINCLILAIVPGVSHALVDQMRIYARLESMFVILAFSPTPGGAGFHEYVFGDFLVDYVPLGISVVVAFVWRLLTYYSYLFAGAIVIPNWLQGIIAQRRAAERDQSTTEPVGEE